MRLDQDVLAALSTLEYPAQNRAVLTEQLERATYVRVDKALQALGGKWNRGAKAHVFPGDARERVDAAITTGEELLAPAGIMVCVLPASVTFRGDRRYREFRAWAQDVGVIDELPDGSFRPSGTGVRTVTLTARAP